MNNPETVKFVNEYMNNNADKILDAMGRTYTAEELAVKLGDNNQASADQRCLSAADVASIYNV